METPPARPEAGQIAALVPTCSPGAPNEIADCNYTTTVWKEVGGGAGGRGGEETLKLQGPGLQGPLPTPPPTWIGLGEPLTLPRRPASSPPFSPCGHVHGMFSPREGRAKQRKSFKQPRLPHLCVPPASPHRPGPVFPLRKAAGTPQRRGVLL